MNKKTKRHIIIAIHSLMITGIAAFIAFYIIFLSPNITHVEGFEYIYIRPGDSMEEVFKQLDEKVKIKRFATLKFTVNRLKYAQNVKSGRYPIYNDESNIDFVRRLRSGKQEPLMLTFNSVRTKSQLAGRISSQLMADSAHIDSLLNDTEFVAQYNLEPHTIISMFIPNSYEFFWDTDADAFIKRMKREYDAFWTAERLKKAEAIPMSPTEVITLASIVNEESNKVHEHPIIAGLYINRIKKGMLLQADPTVKFAVGDFGLRRILKSHLAIDSPYNTYKYKGLPPGPIRAPNISCIDGVLNYQKHNYLYMAAKETFNGEHNFAATYDQHLRNARKYHQALNARKIFN